jgi:hypothetical protein
MRPNRHPLNGQAPIVLRSCASISSGSE